MAGDSRLSARFGSDTSDFKAGITAINRELRVVESGFRASASALGDWGSSATGLEQRIAALNSKIELQKEKVGALTVSHERAVTAYGANSKAAQDLEISLNKETEALNGMQTELGDTQSSLGEMAGGAEGAGKATQDTGEKTEDAGKKAEGAGTKFAGFGAIMDGLKTTVKVGVAAIIGLSAAVIGVGAAVTGLVLKTAETADGLVAMSDQTGIGVERLQELAYVANQVGVSQETITGSLAKLTRSMGQATSQTADYQAAVDAAAAKGETYTGDLGEQAAAFDKLGISVVDSNGNLRDSEAVFNDALTALGGVGNETERDVLAMAIFGKSATELNPLIKAGADEIANLSEEARKNGAVMGTDNVNAMAAFNDTLDGLKAGLTGTLGTLAGAFLPAFQGLAGQAGGYLQDFTSIVNGSGGDITKVGEGVGGLIGQIATDLAKQAPQMLTAGLGIIQSLITSLMTALPSLLPVVIQIITTLVQFLVQNLPLLVTAGISLLLALINGIVPQLPLLLQSALQMILTLAQGLLEAIPQIIPVIIEIIPQMISTLVEMLPQLIETGIQLLVALILGLAQALPEIIPAVIGIIPTIITTLLDNLPLLVGAALTLIIALATGLVSALPTLIESVPEIIGAIIDTIVELLPLIGTAALTLITTLVGGLVDNLPAIGKAAGDIITTIVDGIAALATTIWQVGSDLVTGIWQGIQDNAENFKKMVMEFFQGIVDAIKDLLGIPHSPSKVFTDIGSNMALGLGFGFTKTFAGIQNQIESAVEELGGIAGNVTVGGAGGLVAATTSGTPAAGVTVNVYANVASEIDIYKLAYRIADVLQGASPR